MRKNKNFNDDGQFLTYQQTASKSNLGLNTVMKISRESGALIKIGKISRVNWDVFCEHIVSNYQERAAE